MGHYTDPESSLTDIFACKFLQWVLCFSKIQNIKDLHLLSFLTYVPKQSNLCAYFQDYFAAWARGRSLNPGFIKNGEGNGRIFHIQTFSWLPLMLKSPPGIVAKILFWFIAKNSLL